MGSCSSKKDGEKSKSYALQVLDDHDGGINCMALSEDGSVLVTGSEDKTARLWSTKTALCECIGILQGHEGYITCVLLEENFVLTGSSDSTVRKWDISTCECVQVFKGHKSVIYRMICTGDFVFTSSYDRTCLCWDFDTAECVRVFRGHKRGVYPLIFIPADEEEMSNGDMHNDEITTDILITGSADFTARTWNFETGKCIKVFKGHKGAVTCMATDPLGKMLFTGSTDQTIKGWNLYKGDCLRTFEGHTASVICLQVVNKMMYTGSSDHTGRAWVTDFGDCTRIYKGHRHTVSCIKYHDGLLLTGCGDGVCRVFEAKTGTQKQVFKGSPEFAINAFQLNDDHDMHTRIHIFVLWDELFTGAGDCLVRCFDAKSGTLRRQMRGHQMALNCLQIVDDKLFTGSHDGSVRVWDIRGLRDDGVFGKEDTKDKDKMKEIEKMGGLDLADNYQNGGTNGDTKIMIDDDAEYGQDNHAYQNGDLTLDERSRERAVLDMV